MRPRRTTSPLLFTALLLASSFAAASPPAMMCSEEQTLSEEIAASDLVVVGELTQVRKTFSGTMVNVEADFRIAQALYNAPGAPAAKAGSSVTVAFACDSAPIPENLVGYPTVANYCDSQTGMPKTMPPQVSVLTLKTADKKLTLVKRFVWGGCVDLAELKKKSPHVAPLVAKIHALKLPAPTATAPVPTSVTGSPSPAATATATATTTATPAASATGSTPVPPVNTIAPAVTASPAQPPPVPPKSSGCTVHAPSGSPTSEGAGSRIAVSSLLVVALVFGGIARKRTRP